MKNRQTFSKQAQLVSKERENNLRASQALFSATTQTFLLELIAMENKNKQRVIDEIESPEERYRLRQEAWKEIHDLQLKKEEEFAEQIKEMKKMKEDLTSDPEEAPLLTLSSIVSDDQPVIIDGVVDEPKKSEEE